MKNIDNFAEYENGFSFTVSTELEAYKAAHAYQHCKETKISQAPNINGWLVQVVVENYTMIRNELEPTKVYA